MGADCKSVARATEVRILHPPPAAQTAPDLQRCSQGPFTVRPTETRSGPLAAANARQRDQAVDSVPSLLGRVSRTQLARASMLRRSTSTWPWTHLASDGRPGSADDLSPVDVAAVELRRSARCDTDHSAPSRCAGVVQIGRARCTNGADVQVWTPVRSAANAARVRSPRNLQTYGSKRRRIAGTPLARGSGSRDSNLAGKLLRVPRCKDQRQASLGP